MTDISKEDIAKSIKAILKDADLDSLSAKKIRKMLEADYKADFTQRKDEIDKLVMQLITNNDSEEETEKKKEAAAKQTNGTTSSSRTPASPANNGNSKTKNDDLTTNDQDADDDIDIKEDDDDDSDLGEIEDVVPKKKAKMQLSSKKNKSLKKLNDEELAKQLQEEGSRPSRRCKAQPIVRKQRKPRKESAKGTSVYSRPCALLPPLDNVMGTDKMPRPMIVKRLWEIVKARDLLDPKNKQFMLCDAEMQGLFGKNRVRMFGAMKLLKPYVKDLPKE